MNVLSIQSSVAFGYVGNAVAVPVLQRLGIDVWPVNTVTLSNHTDHASWRGAAAEPALVGEIVAGLDDLGVWATCDALLTGYLGDAAIGDVVADALGRLRAANARALYLCDPVMGNTAKGLYVKPETAAAIRERLVPAADIVTPNGFELGLLAGREVSGADEALGACDALRATGPGAVVCTSLTVGDGAVANLAVDAAGAWLVRTPRLDCAANGAGDALAALFLGHSLLGADSGAALAQAVSGVYAVLQATAARGGRDLALIESLDKLANPPETFAAERLR